MDSDERENDFVHKVVSALGEAFNNVALHAYGVSCSGTVDLEISVEDGAVTVRMLDSGRSFDLEGVPGPDLSSLLERSMGLYIMRSFMDEVSYVPGEPPNAVNVMTLSKRYR